MNLYIYMIGLFIIMQHVIQDHIPLDQLPLITSASEWPVFFASAMYVFEGIALVSIHYGSQSKSISILIGFTHSTKNERT